MAQTRLHSLIETAANIISGMFIAFAVSQLAAHFSSEIRQYIWSGFDWYVGASSNAIMTIVLTLVSMIRGYSWRRYFNNRSYNETSKK